jgi:hypothetical protein
LFGEVSGVDDQYQPGIPVPGVRVVGQLRGAWQRAFGDWRPDRRSLGVLLAVLYGVFLVGNLTTVDITARGISFWLDNAMHVSGSVVVAGVIASLGRLLLLPAHLLVAAGGVAMVMRRGWGRGVAVAGLVLLLVADVVPPLVNLAVSPGGSRFSAADLVFALAPLLAVVVLLWSREVDG